MISILLAQLTTARQFPKLNLQYSLKQQWSSTDDNSSVLITPANQDGDTYEIETNGARFILKVKTNTTAEVQIGSETITLDFLVGKEPSSLATAALPDGRLLAVSFFNPYALQVVITDVEKGIFLTYGYAAPFHNGDGWIDALIPAGITAVIVFLAKKFRLF